MDNKPVTTSPHRITDEDRSITEADGVANAWSDIWKFRVPQNVGFVISAGDTFACYLEDASPAECARDGTCRLRIEIRDASEQHREILMGDVVYNKVREFQNRDKIFRFTLPRPKKVYERQWIVIMVIDDAIVDASDSYFELLGSRISKSL